MVASQSPDKRHNNFKKERKKGRCRLTDAGLRLLKKTISNQKETFNGIARRGSVSRDTIPKILDRSSAAKWSSLDRLFDALEMTLEDEHWEEWQDKSSGLRPSKAGKQQPKQAQAISLTTRAQQVADLLWTLNCDDQEGIFKNRCKQMQQAHLFVVQAPDLRIQKWLVKRFLRQYHKPQPYLLDIRGLGIPSDFSKFWQELKSLLMRSNTSLTLSNASPDAILQALCELAQTKPVFIAVFGLHRFQETRDHLLEKFWVPLTQKFDAQTARSVKAKLVVFLIEEPQTSLYKDFQDACLLPPLTELSGIEVQAWIQRPDVYELLTQIIGEASLERLVASDLPNWHTQPVLVLEDVCYAFNLENGIAEVESYWELAG